MSASLETFCVGLSRMIGWIDRAEEHLAQSAREHGALLHRSLARTLSPLGKQILATSRHAELDLARAAGIEAPARRAIPMTLSDLRERVVEVLGYVRAIVPTDIAGDHIIEFGRLARRMTTPDYLQLYSIPHFYFHLSVVYLMLRSNGVPLGKSDFVREIDIMA